MRKYRSKPGIREKERPKGRERKRKQGAARTADEVKAENRKRREKNKAKRKDNLSTVPQAKITTCYDDDSCISKDSVYRVHTDTEIICIVRVYHSVAENEREPEFKPGTWTKFIKLIGKVMTQLVTML